MEEERIGYCKNCDALEFDIDADDVKILTGPHHGRCLIEDCDGRAHSLVMAREWERMKDRTDLEDDAASEFANTSDTEGTGQ